MGFFDKKVKTETTNVDQTQNTTTEALDQRAAGDNSNIAGNITGQNIGSVTTTDYGAIEKSFDFSTGALDAATNIAANSFQYADNANTNALLFGESALRSNQIAMALTKDLAGSAFDTVYKNSKNALDNAAESQKGALSTVDKTVSSMGTIVGNAVSKISDVVKGANTSDSVQTIQYIAGAVIFVAVAYMFLKGNK